MTSHALDPLSPCHKLSHLLGPPSSVTYFMDGPNVTTRLPVNAQAVVLRWLKMLKAFNVYNVGPNRRQQRAIDPCVQKSRSGCRLHRTHIKPKFSFCTPTDRPTLVRDGSRGAIRPWPPHSVLPWTLASLLTVKEICLVLSC